MHEYAYVIVITLMVVSPEHDAKYFPLLHTLVHKMSSKN